MWESRWDKKMKMEKEYGKDDKGRREREGRNNGTQGAKIGKYIQRQRW